MAINVGCSWTVIATERRRLLFDQLTKAIKEGAKERVVVVAAVAAVVVCEGEKATARAMFFWWELRAQSISISHPRLRN
jgi:hypothetical protein